MKGFQPPSVSITEPLPPSRFWDGKDIPSQFDMDSNLESICKIFERSLLDYIDERHSDSWATKESLKDVHEDVYQSLRCVVGTAYIRVNYSISDGLVITILPEIEEYLPKFYAALRDERGE